MNCDLFLVSCCLETIFDIDLLLSPQTLFNICRKIAEVQLWRLSRDTSQGSVPLTNSLRQISGHDHSFRVSWDQVSFVSVLYKKSLGKK